MSVVFNKVLKKLINQPRPVGAFMSGPGMPSAHSQFMGFFAAYVVIYTWKRFDSQILLCLLRLVDVDRLVVIAVVDQVELASTTGAMVHYLERDCDGGLDVLLAHSLELPLHRPSDSRRGSRCPYWGCLVRLGRRGKMVMQLL